MLRPKCRDVLSRRNHFSTIDLFPRAPQTRAGKIRTAEFRFAELGADEVRAAEVRGVRFALLSFTPPDKSGKASNCAAGDSLLLEELGSAPQRFYVDIHNDEYPTGALRGQLGEEAQ